MSDSEDPGREDMVRAIRSALWKSQPIRALSLDQIQIDVKDDIVELRGVVASEPIKYVAEQITAKVPGVKAVVNRLITDDELERQFAAALAAHPDLHGLRISVSATEGVVSLFGAVSSDSEAQAARDLALAVPAVVGVENSLHVLDPDRPVILTWQGSLEGRPLRTPERQDEAAPSESPQEVATAPVEG